MAQLRHQVVTASWASVPGYVYSWSGSATAWNRGGSANQGFGPLSLLATTGSSPSPTTTTTTTASTTTTTASTTTTTATSTTTTTAPSSAGTPTPLVASFTPTALRRDFDGWVGMQVRVGAEDLRVSSVGRWVVSGNRDSHTVKLVEAATGADVAGGSATVATAGAPAGAFSYAALPAPVTLRANTTYYLVSLEREGGDQWHNFDTRVVTASWASVPGYVYSWSGSATAWNRGGSANQGFGPLSLLASRST